MSVLEDEAVGRIAPIGAAEGCLSRLEQEVTGLFDQFRERLLRYLLSMGVGAADGEEIVQEVFLALFQHLRRGKSQRNLRAWLFQVAHNLGLKQLSRMRRAKETLGGPEEFGLELRRADPGPNPEDQLAWRQRQQRFVRVLRALPEQDRRQLSLRAEGLTYREIAEVLDISVGGVSLSLGRSLARLGRALKE
ncbi:MAG TPA: sigma-70 family RNA polymerase sigma factor [Bryobacteraceae bacterium]|nr:sigma-70 family RNA polymerase sigma factor [Bryobacteraceae bacterium]